MNTSEIPQEHRAVIVNLFQEGDKLLEKQTEFDISLWHAATGIATEAGELIEAILPVQLSKDFAMHPLTPRTSLGGSKTQDPWRRANGDDGVDIENIEEELGDHLFYEGALRILTGLEQLPESVEVTETLWPHLRGPLSLANDPDVGRKRVLIDLILIHAALSAQILDVAKRVAAYRTPFTGKFKNGVDLKQRLTQHLVDDCWVVEQIAAVIGGGEEHLREGNIVKLVRGKEGKAARYAKGFSSDAAHDRANKDGEQLDPDAAAGVTLELHTGVEGVTIANARAFDREGGV